MKIETVVGLVMAEIERAEKLHPVWPRDLIHAGMLCAEECGEMSKAILDHDERKGSKAAIITEAVHIAATAIRLLKNIAETIEND